MYGEIYYVVFWATNGDRTLFSLQGESGLHPNA